MKTTTTIYKVILRVFLISLLVSIGFSSCNQTQKTVDYWSDISSQEKPWTRWWWMGNILNEEDITYQLEAFAEAGLGGVEITPIYGVKGYEDSFLDHLSPEWIEMLDHTLKEADRLGLGVDMVQGTGWPFGGPQVEPEFAASRLYIKKIHLEKDKTFSSHITIDDPKQQGLAELKHIMFIDEDHKAMDLTPLLNNGELSFTPSKSADLYAVFCAKTRQRVKRSAPGGDGYTLDHFSKAALKDYLIPYEKVIQPFGNRLRSMFNDSYEVYGADFTPGMMEEFKSRRGYSLLDYIDILSDKPDNELYSRILCDYRETLSDLLLEDFAMTWTDWNHENSFLTKYQAHGSPGNLIDLYAAADIPECEVFGSPEYDIPGYRRDTNNVRKGDSNKMMLKFCSSAANLSGKNLVSSESFTWLREHFKTALSHCKPVADDLFLSGVNHIFLHGSTYSPENDPWPGFKFYASVNFNPTNTIWKDAPFLFEYISRCQALLQNSTSDNQVLLYWPIYDAYSEAGKERLLYQYNIHSIEEWLLHTSFYSAAEILDSKGIGFDFISDRFLEKCSVHAGLISLSEEVKYKTLIIPDTRHMPLETLSKLLELKQAGAEIILLGLPETVPGYNQFEIQEENLLKVLEEHPEDFVIEKDLDACIKRLNIKEEVAVQRGLKVLRKKIGKQGLYFIANHSAKPVNDYIDFSTPAKSVQIMDPMTGTKGIADIKSENDLTKVRLYLLPGESVFLLMSQDNKVGKKWNYPLPSDEVISLDGKWELSFPEDNSKLNKQEIEKPVSWTSLGPEYEAYSGSAKYVCSFNLNELEADAYYLNLGDVRESARVYLNGEFAGARIAQPFIIDISEYLKQGSNQLEIEVTNLPANRLRQMELSGKEWKKFYEINMVNIHYETFDARTWKPMLSGLNSSVSLVPVYYDKK